jgi:uncharacterized protein (DUF608 family)
MVAGEVIGFDALTAWEACSIRPRPWKCHKALAQETVTQEDCQGLAAHEDESAFHPPRMIRPAPIIVLQTLLLLGTPWVRGSQTVDQSPTQSLPSLGLAEKKLDPAWVASLTARGEPEVWSGAGLKYIGMPVGGCFAGQLYLGGDGTLWFWQIFNEIVNSGANGEHYSRPMIPSSPLEQGFSLKIGDRSIPLDSSGFSEVSFRGEYPVGTVEYKDPGVPLAVTLEAFSPFIPLDVEDSSLPATVLRFTLTNSSPKAVEGMFFGFLENAVGLHHRSCLGERDNRVIREKGFTFLECSAKGTPGELMPLGSTTNALKVPFEQLPDVGTMGLALMGAPADFDSGDKTSPLAGKLTGSLGRSVKLAPGQSVTVTFVVTWFFPNLAQLPRLSDQGRRYAGRFDSALDVARHVASNERRLVDDTLLWRRTWYDSTLPYWFLDRTFLNISIMATDTSYRLRNGRYWAWEGVGSCAGTCGHVYHYGQALARLFPEIEREQRESVDFATSQKSDGAILFRGENNRIPAIDAQAGYILRALREHQMSESDAFLKRVWPHVKLAMDWMIAKDGMESGIIHGNQHNTLDRDWYGEVAWLSGLYQAALLASARMAELMGEPEYAEKCGRIASKGRGVMTGQLFNGEYYQNKVDPAHPDAINSGSGCEIDQVIGQGWAFQLGLPRVTPKKETVSALNSLWRYNFLTDVGPFRAANKPGRWYAMPGEAGLLMCTFPKDDWDYAKAAGRGPEWAAGYFNECMNGFEHQVAGHMIWEGSPDSDLVTKGLAIERAIHDRYNALKRNPYNEIECGDHYGRSMASYGVFLAACGYEYDGPAGYIAFAPRINPRDFKAAFTAAEGWGSYSQKISGATMEGELTVRWGKVRLRSFGLATSRKSDSVVVECGHRKIGASFENSEGKTVVVFSEGLTVKAGESLRITLHLRKESVH